MVKRVHMCSRCMGRMATSSLRWYDLPLFLFLLQPMRCRECSRRRYRFIFGGYKVPMNGRTNGSSRNGTSRHNSSSRSESGAV